MKREYPLTRIVHTRIFGKKKSFEKINWNIWSKKEFFAKYFWHSLSSYFLLSLSVYTFHLAYLYSRTKQKEFSLFRILFWIPNSNGDRNTNLKSAQFILSKNEVCNAANSSRRQIPASSILSFSYNQFFCRFINSESSSQNYNYYLSYSVKEIIKIVSRWAKKRDKILGGYFFSSFLF